MDGEAEEAEWLEDKVMLSFSFFVSFDRCSLPPS
jgi:hypothetical protein